MDKEIYKKPLVQMGKKNPHKEQLEPFKAN